MDEEEIEKLYGWQRKKQPLAPIKKIEVFSEIPQTFSEEVAQENLKLIRDRLSKAPGWANEKTT